MQERKLTIERDKYEILEENYGNLVDAVGVARGIEHIPIELFSNQFGDNRWPIYQKLQCTPLDLPLRQGGLLSLSRAVVIDTSGKSLTPERHILLVSISLPKQDSNPNVNSLRDKKVMLVRTSPSEVKARVLPESASGEPKENEEVTNALLSINPKRDVILNESLPEELRSFLSKLF